MQIKELETEAKELAPQVKALIPEGEALKGEFGDFIVQKRATWKYTSAVTTLEAQLDEQMKKEQADGSAEKKEAEILYYKPFKSVSE